MKRAAQVFVVWLGLDRSGTTVRRGTLPLPGTRFLTESLAGICVNVKAMRRNQVKQSTKDQIKGSLHEAKGTVKEQAGQVINNPNLTAEGRDENLVGKVQKKVGRVEEVFEK
jgi:uncharacterized protein YjbJ (UPF0337 family)